MENRKESKPSFWSTLPGMLTAIGGIIGACAALITALYAAGLIGPAKPTNSNNPPAVSPTPTAAAQANNSRANVEAARDEASRDFVVGRWRVEQASGAASGASVVDYNDDGTFSGTMTIFVGGEGRKQDVAGRWDFDKLSRNTFRLKLQFENQGAWAGTFKIIDHDHIHNTDENYVAVRSY